MPTCLPPLCRCPRHTDNFRDIHGGDSPRPGRTRARSQRTNSLTIVHAKAPGDPAIVCRRRSALQRAVSIWLHDGS